nr:hypothetical protein [uncultured Arsenicibacter sp.]
MAKQQQVEAGVEQIASVETGTGVISDELVITADTVAEQLDTSKKALDNTNIEDVKKTTPDVKVTGNGDLFQLIAKASSDSQGWMKSTKAMETPGGCVVQVTSEFRDSNGRVTACAEAITFVPGVAIGIHDDGTKGLIPAYKSY